MSEFDYKKHRGEIAAAAANLTDADLAEIFRSWLNAPEPFDYNCPLDLMVLLGMLRGMAQRRADEQRRERGHL